MLDPGTWLAPVSALDGLRRWLLRVLGGFGIQLVRRPELRVALRGSVAVLLALVGSLTLPLWILAVGPLVLGVPHLLADVRYLVARKGHQRSRRLVIGVGLPLLVCGLGGGMPAGLCAMLGALLLGEGDTVRKLIGVLLVSTIAATGLIGHSFYVHELLLAHLHNPIGVVLWLLWRPRQERLHLIPLLLYVACGVLIGLGALLPPAFALTLAPQSADSALDFMRDTLAPGFSQTWGTRLLLLYCYAQMVHYSVWLQLVPEEDRHRPTPRSFRDSLRALRADLSLWLLVPALLIMLGLLIWGFADVWASRIAYFRLALFHGYLELCALCLWFAAGRRPQGPRPLVAGKHGLLPTTSAR
mgnify:FL=1